MKKKALLVEDDPPTIDVMERELRFLGYEVVVAENGQKALDLAPKEAPDLIVLDMRMPRIDGFETARRLRSDPRTSAMPILAATVLAMPDEKQRCLEAGCDEHIAKPFTYKELGSAMERAIARRQSPGAKQ